MSGAACAATGPEATWAEPTSAQNLLLRASLLRGPEAIDAWRAWRSGARIDTLDRDSQWLLPLLYRNLHAQGVSTDLLIRYRNVYLHNWYKNNLTLRRVEPAIRRLQRGGGTVMLLGGGAMALQHYEMLGARPFGPLCLLVRACAESIDALSDVGDDAVDVRTSLFGADVDEAVAQRARGCEWKTMRVRVLHPADQLVDICVRRHEWDRRSRLFWLADGATVVRRHPDMDWDRVATLATQVGQAMSVAGALRILDGQLELGIPTAVQGGPTPLAAHVST